MPYSKQVAVRTYRPSANGGVQPKAAQVPSAVWSKYLWQMNNQHKNTRKVTMHIDINWNLFMFGAPLFPSHQSYWTCQHTQDPKSAENVKHGSPATVGCIDAFHQQISRNRYNMCPAFAHLIFPPLACMPNVSPMHKMPWMVPKRGRLVVSNCLKHYHPKFVVRALAV